ncbi:MAG: hypothetical protein Q4G33_04010, partial [bacterium]|nr:hypothetical protein [bacterium]
SKQIAVMRGAVVRCTSSHKRRRNASLIFFQNYNMNFFHQCVWEKRSKQIAVMRGAVVRCTSSHE